MSLRTSPPLTEQVLSILSGIEDIFDVPRSMRQLVYRHEYEHWKLATRRKKALQRARKRVKQALWNLQHAEYITAEKHAKGVYDYRLTPKGWLKFAMKYATTLKTEATISSDTSIRKGAYVIIFDIPETYRAFRDTFRRVPINLGCIRLQKSIFLTHDARATQFIARIMANCELEDRVKILLVKSIL